MKCWKCGKKEATQEIYGYPVCDDCEDIDPEEMEMVVIESLGKGRITALDELDQRKL